MRRLRGEMSVGGKTPDPVEQDYQTVFRSEAGERVLRNLMQRSCIWEQTFDPNPYVAAFNEGRRAVVLGIMDMARKKMELPTEYTDEATQAEMDYAVEQVYKA